MIVLLRLALLAVTLTLSSTASAQMITLSYYDTTKPTSWIEAPGVQGEFAYTGLGQRFTLPSNTGLLDSIRIHFDSVSGDLLHIAIFRDVVRETSRGTFHLPDYSFTGLIYREAIDLTGLDTLRNFWMTIPMPNLPVPREFHIGIGANQENDDVYSSAFRLMGQRYLNHEPTIDSRSDILLTQDFVTFTPDIFDGFFTFNGSWLGMDFHIDAVVDLTGASVRSKASSSVQMYPNPVASGGQLHLSSGEATGPIKLYDILGVEVASWQSTETSISLPALAPGVYTIISGSGDALHAEKLLIQ